MYIVIYFLFRLFIGHSEKAFMTQSTFNGKWSVITIYCTRFFGVLSHLIFISIWHNNRITCFADDVS